MRVNELQEGRTYTDGKTNRTVVRLGKSPSAGRIGWKSDKCPFSTCELSRFAEWAKTEVTDDTTTD